MKSKKKTLEQDRQSLVKLVNQIELDLGMNVSVNGGSLKGLPLYDFLLVMQKSVKTSDERALKKYVECISHFCMKLSYLNDRWAFQNKCILDFSLYDHADILCSFFLQYQEHRDIISFRNNELSAFIEYFRVVESTNSGVSDYLSYRYVRIFLTIFCMGFNADASVVCQFLRNQFWIYEGFNPRSKLSEEEQSKLMRRVKVQRAKHSKRFRDRMKESVRKVVKTSKSNPSEQSPSARDPELSVAMDADYEVKEDTNQEVVNNLEVANDQEVVYSPEVIVDTEVANSPSEDILNPSDSFSNVIEVEPSEQERLEQERLEKERLEQERLEKERLEKERLEQERLAQEHLKQERLKQERLKQERLKRERLKQERLEQERLEKERLEKERLEKERLEQKRLEEERLKQQRLKEEKLKRERLERERLEKERLEQERLEKQRLERERLEYLERMKEQERQRILEAKRKKEEIQKQEEFKREVEENNKNNFGNSSESKPSGLRNSSIF